MDPISKAFRAAPRQLFLPDDQVHSADIDIPIHIGYRQTNSQPSTVKRMLEWLEVKKGHKILDVGSGSGWTTALLANLTGPTGQVYAVERIPELLEFGKTNVKKLDIKNVKFFKAGKDYGLAKYAPFNRILVNASAKQLPETLMKQLALHGRMIVPVKHDILVVEKTGNDKFQVSMHPGYSFVPLL
jgi:protein-L-isoaspartate(D-aspartate) O-methyltransferase